MRCASCGFGELSTQRRAWAASLNPGPIKTYTLPPGARSRHRFFIPAAHTSCVLSSFALGSNLIPFPPMRCPFCDAEKESLKVIDSRTCEGGRAIRRRRQCLNCDKRFTTYEKIEQNVRLTFVKKDGRRVPWDLKKIFSGLERACFKRPGPAKRAAAPRGRSGGRSLQNPRSRSSFHGGRPARHRAAAAD